MSLNVNNINPKLAIIIPIHPAKETLSCRNNNEKIVINIGDKQTSNGDRVIETKTIMKTYKDSRNLASFLSDL